MAGTKQLSMSKRTDDKTLVEALKILSRDIQSADGIANAAILEAASRLEELTQFERLEESLDMLHGPRESFRKILTSPHEILNRICRNAELRAIREKVPAWSIVSKITGHGSGVSAAIFNVYRKE